MINVSNETKQAYMSDVSKKTLRVVFPELNCALGNESVEVESMNINEALMNKDSMEFVGCISTSLKIRVYGILDNIKGKKIELYISADGTDEIPLFKGIVDSAVIDSNKLFKEIIAYDSIYSLNDVDVSAWYKTAGFPMSMEEMRNSFFDYVGLTQEQAVLPNDKIVVSREYIPERMSAIDVIKSICQFNGCCGIINRQGNFEYRIPKGMGDPNAIEIPFHKSMNYEEFVTNKITRVEVRDEEDGEAIGHGSGTNKYIIQGNMFVFGLSRDSKRTICSNIYEVIKDFQYRPVEMDCMGLPFVEVGQTLKFKAITHNGRINIEVPLLNRTISGVQLLTDKCNIKGKEFQTEFITDINAQLEAIKRTTDEIKSISQRQIDYIIPTDLDESPIDDGSNNNVLTFEFNNITEGEKTSFYSCMNFETETSVIDDVFMDCHLTAKIIVDDEVAETVDCDFGDGGQCLMLNYLVKDITKGNHTLIVNFSVNGGSINGINFVSAYMIATASVDSGTTTEDYDAFDDEGNWSDDVLPDGLVPEIMTEEAYESGSLESMIKIARAKSPTVTAPGFSALSEWFRSKYILMHCEYYGEVFYKKNGYYRKDGKIGYQLSNYRVTGKPIAWGTTSYAIPIKRIKGYHFFKYKAKTIQDNGRDSASGPEYNYVRAGVGAIIDGKMEVRIGTEEALVEDWKEYSVGISTLPYVDYIILIGNYGSPGYKDMRFVR